MRESTAAALSVMVSALIVVGVLAVGDARDARLVTVSKADRAAVTLHECYPEGIYQADAAPTCPAFRKHLEAELLKSENIFNPKKGNTDATSQ